MQKITIYSTPTCHFCHMAKDHLQDHNIPFTDIDVSVDMAARTHMMDMTGQMGVPVIMIEQEEKDPVVMVGFNQKLIDETLGIND